MSTTETSKLTPKQTQVFNLLTQGLRPPQIAKRMKITNSGVYGHIRTMRKQGVALPSEQVAPPVEPAPTPDATSPNGQADFRQRTVEEFLADAVSHAEMMLHETDALIAQRESEIEEAKTDREKLAERIGKLQAAEAQLA